MGKFNGKHLKIKKIEQKWLSIGSIVAFYIGFFISLVFLFLFENIRLYQILNCIFAILFVYRLVYRYKKINSLTYYSLEDKEQVTDQKMRGYQLGDIVAIMMNFLLLVVGSSDFMNQYGNNLFWVVGFYTGIFFIIASLAIIKNNIGLRIICIIMSTMQGVMSCLFLAVVVLSQIKSITEGNSLNNMSIITDSALKSIIDLGFVFEKTPILTISTILVSISLYTILIIGTPVYQQEQLIFSFKTVTIIIALSSIITFFMVNTMAPDIIQYASDTFKNIENNKEFVGAPLEYILYYKEYAKGNISNLFYLLLLPYTFGILVANLVIDFVKRKNMKYANESLNNIREIKSNNSDCMFEYYMKRYLYHGGEKWKYEMIARQVEMEKILYEFKNNNCT